MAAPRPRTVTTPDHRVVTFTPPTRAGWQFMARELDAIAARIDAGQVGESEALDLRNIAVLLRQVAEAQGA